MPTIVISSAAPHDTAATEMEKQQKNNNTILNTCDREQKSLTTGNISPKQKILHNIL